ncbi:HPr kinase/phosphorylase [Sphingomonas fuzhouensis]|uniref:HPr kinase/phosphorylase n=1 Tax=Sphingomonas fuzhouensis TaxID=3106033 RepID=UPI002B002900|nr:HPr kinase/phosphatase C-terminal domain-containing protein [Sphingomonas sp. SGZ-02]
MKGELIHASCVAIGDVGVLLRGPSGSGKSDLALRLIDRGATLIADDYVAATCIDGALHVTVPERIAGLIEVRGVGILPLPYRPTAIIGLVIDLGDEERLPDPQDTVIAGVTIPIYRLNPLPASAPIKVELLVSRVKERL